MNRKQIEDYLGITDNEDFDYKNKVIAEYKTMKQRYPKYENALIEDLGVYIPYSRIIATGEYIAVFE